MAVTTTKVKYTGRRVKVEAKGILRSSKSKFETFDTFTMHRGRRQRNKASSTKHWERCSTPDDNKLPNVYSPSQSSTTGSCSTANEKYQFRRVERDHDMGKDIVGSNYNEEIVCCKSCCDDDKLYDHHPMLPEGILSTCSVSEVYTQENQSPTNVTCPQALSDTSPPQEFADGDQHLRPPEPALKDIEEARDRWAKRRKLFKESKQWSSAGGSSVTSNITEESVNSEDTHSVDLNMRDIEDRGFYTETFHSASWMYCGDEAHSDNDPGCLRKRPRPVTIRERTVRISKGTGEYPWGFRIQFSKPIVVTEVDTNGAAEEAGLQVGDYVLSVNGTDVSSVPHSEAAELARRGPDLLTLTIGSDISRYPNTPKPACRGYLHKRTQSGFLKGWRKRWFVLKHDSYLYYYRHKKDEGKSKALSFLKLEGADVEPDMSLGKPHVFRCCPVSRSRIYYYCATSNQEMKRWLEAMNRAAHPVSQNHVWVDVTRHNASLPPLAIKKPECLGLLHQLDKEKDIWVQYYCILKDGCLYFYTGIRATSAGYTLGGLWILALKVSISKWLPLHEAIKDYMKRPPEETRM
uniref:PDZ and pleckstrin homology domains 1 n=1 Tax=Paramormyrops kingsleyae TaxID=1676925 RepID=A0A3B3QCT3_9TELE